MMTDRLARLIATVLVLAGTAGCGSSASPHFYTIDSAATPSTALPMQTAVMVGPVLIPASVDQPQLVVQVAPNRVEVEEFDRWAAPLGDGIARAVAGDLSVLLDTPNVTTAPLAGFSPAYFVTINVQQFESIKGEAALVDAVWTVHSVARGKTWSGRTIAREPVQTQDFDALAAAHSRAIAKLSNDIATAIRTGANVNT